MAFSDALKASVRKRSLGRCCVCQEPFVDVHHIIPQAEGGPDTDDNAAPLCPNCHRRNGDNPRQRAMIREFRDNWYEQIASKLVQVELTIELVDHGLGLKTLDDFERYVLDLSVNAPMAAFLQLYQQITEHVRIVGRALEMQNTEIWNIPVGVALLRAHLQNPHLTTHQLSADVVSENVETFRVLQRVRGSHSDCPLHISPARKRVRILSGRDFQSSPSRIERVTRGVRLCSAVVGDPHLPAS